MSLRAVFSVPTMFSAAAVIGLACAGPGAAQIADASRADMSGPVSSLAQAVRKGADIFAHESFGGAGACETCHSNGGRTAGKAPNGAPIPSLVGAAADFPKYSARSQTVITLSQQMARCIAGALHGNPPAFGSPELVSLEAYLTSLSKGAVMGKQFE